MNSIGNCAGTARYYMSGIQTLYSEVGVSVKPLRMPLVKRTLKGIERIPRPPRHPRLPITVAVLTHIAPLINFHSHYDRTIWAMMCLATYGLLRCGEITSDSHDRTRYPRAMHWNLEGDRTFGVFFLPQSKNDPSRQGQFYLAANGS